MGTVLSFSPREKAGPPYGGPPDYGTSRSKENIYEGAIGNQNFMMSGPNSANSINPKSGYGGGGGIPNSSSTKSLKKHGMFLNALSWKKFTSSNSSGNISGVSGDHHSGSAKKNKQKQHHHDQAPAAHHVNGNNYVASHPAAPLRQFGRQPFDNIHPMIDSNKNIHNALCHGAKSTKLNEKHLDLAPQPVSAVKGSINDNLAEHVILGGSHPTTSSSSNIHSQKQAITINHDHSSAIISSENQPGKISS